MLLNLQRVTPYHCLKYVHSEISQKFSKYHVKWDCEVLTFTNTIRMGRKQGSNTPKAWSFVEEHRQLPSGLTRCNGYTRGQSESPQRWKALFTVLYGKADNHILE